MVGIAPVTAGGASPRWLRPLVRVALLSAAFAFMWGGERQYLAWAREASATFQPNSLGWFAYILLEAGVGFCFALAAFLPAGRVTFRPLQALMLALLPVLGLLHFAALFLWSWHLPHVLSKVYFYLGSGPQALLAALVGVALVAGIRGGHDVAVPRDAG